MSIGNNPFYQKSYGRIYVLDPTKVGRVLEIIKGVDEFEWGYYIEGLVAPWTGKVELIYTHKFEACMDTITLRCWNECIAVWCISQRDEFFGVDKDDPAKTPGQTE